MASGIRKNSGSRVRRYEALVRTLDAYGWRARQMGDGSELTTVLDIVRGCICRPRKSETA